MNPHPRIVKFIVLLTATPIVLVAWASAVSYPRWRNWHRAGAGLPADVHDDRQIAERLSPRSRLIGCIEEGCIVEPIGMPRLSLQFQTQSHYTYILKFDSPEAPKRWHGSGYSD